MKRKKRMKETDGSLEEVSSCFRGTVGWMKEKGKMKGWPNEEDVSSCEPSLLYNGISVMATKQAGGIEDVCVTISRHLCQLDKRKKSFSVILWVRRVLRIPPHMWSTLPTTLLRQSANLLGLVMLQTRVKNHPGTAQSWIQEVTAAKPNISIKNRICSRRLSADLFHLLSSSLFPTCDYTTCNYIADTRKMNKKIWFRSKTFCDALCTIHRRSTIIYRFELREVTRRSNDIGSVGQKTARLYDMLTSDSTPVCDS